MLTKEDTTGATVASSGGGGLSGRDEQVYCQVLLCALRVLRVLAPVSDPHWGSLVDQTRLAAGGGDGLQKNLFPAQRSHVRAHSCVWSPLFSFFLSFLSTSLTSLFLGSSTPPAQPSASKRMRRDASPALGAHAEQLRKAEQDAGFVAMGFIKDRSMRHDPVFAEDSSELHRRQPSRPRIKTIAPCVATAHFFCLLLSFVARPLALTCVTARSSALPLRAVPSALPLPPPSAAGACIERSKRSARALSSARAAPPPRSGAMSACSNRARCCTR